MSLVIKEQKQLYVSKELSDLKHERSANTYSLSKPKALSMTKEVAQTDLDKAFADREEFQSSTAAVWFD